MNILIARPGGFYDGSVQPRASLADDLSFLLDADVHIDCPLWGACPRADVLIIPLPEVEAIYEHEFR